MEVKLRTETSADFNAVFRLIEEAFLKEQFSDGKEQFLVERLRKSEAFIPELSIVAEYADEIVIPFKAPEENCMVIELVKNGLSGVSGTIQYDRAFYQY
jgi:predicted N-acetyltransferase YhbS